MNHSGFFASTVYSSPVRHAAVTAKMFASPHPYYPRSARIQGYAPNTLSLGDLAIRFAGLLTITIVTAVWLARRLNPRLSLAEKSVLGWFVLCK